MCDLVPGCQNDNDYWVGTEFMDRGNDLAGLCEDHLEDSRTEPPVIVEAS